MPGTVGSNPTLSAATVIGSDHPKRTLMVESMTGFGRGEAVHDGLFAEVEVRSVNNRFCEVSVRLPRHLATYEYEIQQIVRQTVGRGKVNVHVRVDNEESAGSGLRLEPELAKSYQKLLEDLRETTGIDGDILLEHLLHFTDLFVQDNEDEDESSSWKVVQEALTLALEDFRSMRQREGESLADDLRQRLELMSGALGDIEKRAPERIEEAAVRLKARVASLIEDEKVDETRLATEIAMLADRFDITEECVRLRSHIAVFREALDGAESPGRKLNFLTQEIHREVNTIGSKANDFSISNQSVILKEELERIREQVQNIQ
ncbi:MAG TPA: YicC/YloC family endoribonuclease [Rhodothermia bacterium]